MIAITSIPAFNDNYFWLIHDNNNAIVVDPGLAEPVLYTLDHLNLELTGILVTHHHADHCGGIAELKTKYQCPVWGSSKDNIATIDRFCDDGDLIDIEELSIKIQVISVPGHTRNHLAYFLPNSQQSNNVLFCGDTLFSAGCGRLFEGTAEQMWKSLQKLMDLPDDTHIYPAHEYTLSNLEFAAHIEPDNKMVSDYLQHVSLLRKIGIPSLPSNINLEKQINPFLRIKEPAIQKIAQSNGNATKMNDSQVFATIRELKDRY